MHDGTGHNVKNFDDLLDAYKPMIFACIRKLNIYKNHDTFKQVGFIALWKAWMKYDSSKGDFAPFAYRSIYGAMLDEIKKENLNEERYHPLEDEQLSNLLEKDKLVHVVNDRLSHTLKQLSANEKELLVSLFVEQISLQQAAKKYGITVSGIKKRRERLLCKMRKLMDNIK